MFCSNCGKEITGGRFCMHCGAPLGSAEAESSAPEPEIVEDTYIEVNGVTVNMSEIVRDCGNDRITAVKTITKLTGVGLREGKKIIDEAYSVLVLTKTFAEEVEEQREKMKTAKQAERERIARLEAEGAVYCPKCHSTSISANKKGFGIGKAVVGAAVVGPIGLVAGNAGAKKIRVTCLRCGHQFWAGKR